MYHAREQFLILLFFFCYLDGQKYVSLHAVSEAIMCVVGRPRAAATQVSAAPVKAQTRRGIPHETRRGKAHFLMIEAKAFEVQPEEVSCKCS